MIEGDILQTTLSQLKTRLTADYPKEKIERAAAFLQAVQALLSA
jgi:hypothetical protein